MPVTPRATARKTPSELTTTIDGLSLVHRIPLAGTSPRAPLTVALTVTDCPTSSEITAGVRAIEEDCCARIHELESRSTREQGRSLVQPSDES